MTKNTSHSRRQRRFGASRQIHIPHSSWTRPECASERIAPVKLEEFWSRLGL